MEYLSWNEKKITDFSDKNIESLYSQGYVFTRVDKGVLNKTRSIRIDLSEFENSSENRRILRKTEEITMQKFALPLINYDWHIHKMGKDFYETKFGVGIFSANKIKEVFTDPKKSNFNFVLVYKINTEPVGYCVIRETENMVHYSYPFYELQNPNKNIGMGMMLKAINYVKEQGKQYIYLGSAQRPTDIYKLQFAGLEWFDGESWSKDLEKLKDTLKTV
jgi:arginyl-tRNA--protein-N-Asp/Glu arginylyltransferase